MRAAFRDFGCANVVVDRLLLDLEPDARGIVVGLMRIGHRDDRGAETWVCRRERLMKIVGECRDAAAAWKLISDEGDPVKSGHRISRRPLRRRFNRLMPLKVDAPQKSDADKAWKPLPRGE